MESKKIKIIVPSAMDVSQLIEESRQYLENQVKTSLQLDFDSIGRGFFSVESELQGIFNATETIFHAQEAQDQGYSGIFIDCFDDPGVYACRELLQIPVFGGYLPAVLTAMSVAERVAIITTDQAGILSEERKARLNGFEKRIVAFDKVSFSVEDIIENRDVLLGKLVDKCVELYEQSRIGAACLGCTAMAPVYYDLCRLLKERECPIQVIEPLGCGVSYLEYILHMGYGNSIKTGLRLDILTWE